MRRTGLAALAAMILSIALAAPAFAGGPTRERFVDESEFDIDCGGFVLHETYADRITVLTWSDASGTPTRLQMHHSWTGTITGPGGILQLSDPGHWTDFFTFGPDGDTVTQVGVVYKLIVKGHGLLAHDVGRITFPPDGDPTFQGPHDVFENGLENLICPLFED